MSHVEHPLSLIYFSSGVLNHTCTFHIFVKWSGELYFRCAIYYCFDSVFENVIFPFAHQYVPLFVSIDRQLSTIPVTVVIVPVAFVHLIVPYALTFAMTNGCPCLMLTHVPKAKLLPSSVLTFKLRNLSCTIFFHAKLRFRQLWSFTRQWLRMNGWRTPYSFICFLSLYLVQ